MHFGSVCSGKSRTGRPAIDLLGQRFGRLLVVERVENDKRVDRPTWRCACDCGSEVTLHGGALRSGRNKSCGCFRRDRAGHLYRKHGLSKTPAYTMFYDARKRAQQAKRGTLGMEQLSKSEAAKAGWEKRRLRSAGLP